MIKTKDRDQAAVEANRLKVRGQGDVAIWNQDCISGMRERLGNDSIDCVVSSIPFGALFSYSHKTEDVGNNQDGVEMDEGQFGLHMRFFFDQLYRVMKPGAVASIHVQQLYTTIVQHSYEGVRDFCGAVIRLAKHHGFHHHGEFVISKNPQRVAQALKKHSLLFVTGRRDSRRLAPAANDYVLLFRKPGEGTVIAGLYDRKENPSGWFTQEEWIRDAHGTWSDIQEIDTLDGWRSARETEEERHVCPLQLTVIRRCIWLYSAPGETVLDPFNGIGSTSYVALEQGRNAIGFELKESYFNLALRNIEKAKREFAQQESDLFSQTA